MLLNNALFNLQGLTLPLELCHKEPAPMHTRNFTLERPQLHVHGPTWQRRMALPSFVTPDDTPQLGGTILMTFTSTSPVPAPPPSPYWLSAPQTFWIVFLLRSPGSSPVRGPFVSCQDSDQYTLQAGAQRKLLHFPQIRGASDLALRMSEVEHLSF